MALQEIKNSKKETHWMWYIFPQLKGLGVSDFAEYYGLKDIKEAKEFLEHSILGERLVIITHELLNITHNNIDYILNYPDNLKLHSCMTLFYTIAGPDSVFDYVLGKYFNGNLDQMTLNILKSEDV